jgi:uncharacterized protein (TIGR02596 family)
MRGACRSQVAFTLVEMLAVLAIISILAALTVPAMNAMVESNNLTRGGQLVVDEINLARQISSSRNITVELRLFKMPGATTSGYTAVQLWATSSTGSAQALSQLAFLPQMFAISENTTVSSALGAPAFATPSTMPAGSGPASGATYLSFEFRPSGVVTPVLNANGLTNMSSYCLTILPARYAASGNATLPKNYVLIQINPITATPLVYRP